MALKIADILSMAKPVTATIKHMGATVTLELRNLTASDSEAVKAAFPEPMPPRLDDSNGRRYLDVTDPAYRVKRDEAMNQRSLAMAALMLGEGFFGAGTLAEWCAKLAGAFSEAQIAAIITQGLKHEQMTPNDLLRARETVRPFDGTPETA